MKISPLGCEYYSLAITSEPAIPAASWELSLDGANWVAATVVDGYPSWLIAGKDYPQQTGFDFRVSTAVTPLVRATSNPETVVRKGPKITPSTVDASKAGSCGC